MNSNVTQAEYMGDGLRLPGESIHQALGANTAHNLAGHLLRKTPAPGHGFQHEAVDKTERDVEHATQGIYANEVRGDGDPEPGTPVAFHLSGVATRVRRALRPGSAA